MENPVIHVIKFVIMLIISSIGLGTLGALALSHGISIAGAACFLIAGMMIGVLVGLFISNIGEENE